MTLASRTIPRRRVHSPSAKSTRETLRFQRCLALATRKSGGMRTAGTTRLHARFPDQSDSPIPPTPAKSSASPSIARKQLARTAQFTRAHRQASSMPRCASRRDVDVSHYRQTADQDFGASPRKMAHCTCAKRRKTFGGGSVSQLRYAIYARYSTDKQNPLFIDAQIRKCREFVARNRWEVLDAHIIPTGYQRCDV